MTYMKGEIVDKGKAAEMGQAVAQGFKRKGIKTEGQNLH